MVAFDALAEDVDLNVNVEVRNMQVVSLQEAARSVDTAYSWGMM